MKIEYVHKDPQNPNSIVKRFTITARLTADIDMVGCTDREQKQYLTNMLKEFAEYMTAQVEAGEGDFVRSLTFTVTDSSEHSPTVERA